MFTFYRTTTDRMSRFPRRNVRTIYNVWISAEVRTCYIFKITNISDSLFQYTVSDLLEIIYIQRDKQTDTDRPTDRQVGRETNRQTDRQRCRRLERQTSRGTGRRSGGQIGSSETGSHRQTSWETDTNSQADTDIDHEPAYTPLPLGILPHGNFWVPWPSKYTVQVVCKWAVAVCVCGAGSNKCTIWNSKLRWSCLLATHLLWQKRPFPYIILSFEQFNML